MAVCDTALKVGSQVIRNDDDWDDGDLYGKAGSIGVVLSTEDLNDGFVKVKWENGKESNFKWGFNGKTEITIYCQGKYKCVYLLALDRRTSMQNLELKNMYISLCFTFKITNMGDNTLLIAIGYYIT